MNNTARIDRAQLLLNQNRPSEAEQEARQALVADPNDFVAQAVLSLCLLDQDKLIPATEVAQQAVAMASDFPFAHYVLARSYHARNQEKSALAAVEETIRLDPDSSLGFGLLAAIHAEAKRWNQSLQAAEQGLVLDPENTSCTNLKAYALQQLGRRDEADMAIDSALKRNPDDDQAHANQGWNALHQGDPKKALVHFGEALRLDPMNEYAKAGLVEALKARNLIYRVMLAYFLWMSRLSGKLQFGILIGGYLGYRILFGVAQENPGWAPFIWPLMACYLIFALLTWLAQPIFNTLLRFNRHGRHALTVDQRRQSSLVTGLLLVIAGIGVCWFTYGGTMVGLSALYVSAATILASSVFACPRGWPRNVMATYAGLFGLMVAFIFGPYFLLSEPTLAALQPLMLVAIRSFVWAFLGGQFLASAMMTQVVRS